MPNQITTPAPSASSPKLTRNDVTEFCTRTHKNFEFIKTAKGDGKDVHVVTQLTLSLLGLIVFPFEDASDEQIFDKSITEISQERWFGWNISLDDPPSMKKSRKEWKETTTLRVLLCHLRNAIAHRRLRFSSDSHHLRDVVITAEDGPNKVTVNWRAEIKGDDLEAFCLQMMALLESAVA